MPHVDPKRVILRERALTRSLARFFPTDPRRVPIGIGDDAAVVRNARDTSVLSCDPVVEGVHFAADTPRAAVGRKVIGRNLSDLAAMGARPDYFVVSVIFRRGTSTVDQRALFRGLRAAASAHGGLVVGGDVAVADGPLVVTVTAIGHVRGRALRRSTARCGDAIHITGPLGGSRLGRHLRIRPRLAEGEWLAATKSVRAALDVSDGLLVDLETLIVASGVPGAELDATAIPLHRDARRSARADGRSALDHALADGEDHELLFTVAAGHALPTDGPLTARARRPIGRLIDTPGLWLIDGPGARRRVAPRGWQHEV